MLGFAQHDSRNLAHSSEISLMKMPRGLSWSVSYWCLGLCLFASVLGMYFLMQRDWAAEPVKVDAITRLGMWISARIPRMSGEYFHGNSMGAVLAVVWPINVGLVMASWRPSLSRAEGPVLSSVEGPVLSVVEGPVLSVSEGPVLSVSEGSHALSSAPRRPVGLFIVSLLVLLFLTFVLIMTVSRGAWLALGTVGGLWLLSRLGSRGIRSPQARTVLLSAGGLIVGALLLLVWSGTVAGLDASHLSQWARNWAGSVSVGQTALNRLDLYHQILTVVRDYPLTGSGLGCFTMVHSTYVLLLHVACVEHAHNLFLDIAVEQGLPGLAAFLGAAAMVGVSLWRRRSEGTVWRTAATLSLVALLVHGLSDDPLYGSRLVPLIFVPFGLSVAASPVGEKANPQPDRSRLRTGKSTIRWRWAATSLLLAVDLVIAGLIWRAPLLSMLFSNLAAVHQTQAELSVYEWPGWAIQDAVRREVDLSRPLRELQQALAYDPGNPTANRRLAMIELSLAQYEGALSHLGEAYAAEPHSNTMRQLLGEALIVNGQLEEGRALWERVDGSQGQLALRRWWYEHFGDEERAKWVRQVVEGFDLER